MDTSLLWGVYLWVGTAVIFADEIAAVVKARWRRFIEREPVRSHETVDGALADLGRTAPTETERAMSLLATQPGPLITARLVELVSGSDPVVARRAALVLFERQDPASLQSLFRYFAKHAQAPR